MDDRLGSQMRFLNEIEKLKLVYRRNKLVDRSRGENSAEHSWHVAMMAMVLAEHVDGQRLDVWRVVKMLLIHDLVEIYAGDTWLYDEAGALEQGDKEEMAAKRLFSLLPSDQAQEMLELRREFEERSTPEGAFAASVDALQPLTNYLLSGQAGDSDPAPARERVVERKRHIEASSVRLWGLAKDLIEKSVERGLYR
jgi:putative hydrolase of HD superfamily